MKNIHLPDADVRLLPGWLGREEADHVFARLLEEVPWRQDTIHIYGKEHLIPRLQQWYGDEGLTYTWSGIRMTPHPWTPLLDDLRRRAESACEARFNTVLLNRYRNGDDTVSWHADDEEELGDNPVIGSVSLGAERDFTMKHVSRPRLKTTIRLTNGSLLLMGGQTQRHWLHSLPRRKGVTEERVNLTFRYVSLAS